MGISSRQDYGAKGCCGPAAFALLAGLFGALALIVGWIA